jgi:hypothetical protein
MSMQQPLATVPSKSHVLADCGSARRTLLLYHNLSHPQPRCPLPTWLLSMEKNSPAPSVARVPSARCCGSPAKSACSREVYQAFMEASTRPVWLSMSSTSPGTVPSPSGATGRWTSSCSTAWWEGDEREGHERATQSVDEKTQPGACAVVIQQHGLT